MDRARGGPAPRTRSGASIFWITDSSAAMTAEIDDQRQHPAERSAQRERELDPFRRADDQRIVARVVIFLGIDFRRGPGTA